MNRSESPRILANATTRCAQADMPREPYPQCRGMTSAHAAARFTTAPRTEGPRRSHDTTAEFWLAAQRAVDLYEAAKRISKLPKPLPNLAT